MGEVDVDASVFRQGFVMSHLRTLIEGHGTAQLAVEAVEDPGEGLGGDLGLAAVQLDQGNEQGGAFNQCANLREVALADNQIALPVAGDQADLDLDGSLIDEHHVRDGWLAAPFFALLRSSGVMPAAHEAEQAGAQMPPRHGVERSVDGLVREPHGIGHTSQCARNLGWTQAPAKMTDHGDPERVARDQPADHARLDGQYAGTPISCNTPITPGNPGRAAMRPLRRHFQLLRRISRRIVDRARIRPVAIAPGFIPKRNCVSIKARSASPG